MPRASHEMSVQASPLPDIQALLELGVQVSKLEQLYGAEVVRAAATDFVTSQAPHAGRLKVGAQLLERSASNVRSALGSDKFVESLLDSLEADPDPMLMDPLFMVPLKDPVVLSSGFVVDRSTALDDRGEMRLQSCPFSRQPLEPKVYPLHLLRDKVKAWKLERLNKAVEIADKLLSQDHVDAAERVFNIAERFMDEVGDATYSEAAKRLAAVERRAPSAKEPRRCLMIYQRLGRMLPEHERVELVRDAVQEFLAGVKKAVQAKDASTASAWLDPSINSWLCGAEIRPLWQAQLHEWQATQLLLAKTLDKTEAVWQWRRVMRTRLSAVPKELQKWLQEEGLTGEEEELQDVAALFDPSLWSLGSYGGNAEPYSWIDESMGIIRLEPGRFIQLTQLLHPQPGRDWSCEVAFWAESLHHESWRNTLLSHHGNATGWEVRVDQHNGVELVWTTCTGHNVRTCGLGADCIGAWTHVVVAYAAAISSTIIFVNGHQTPPQHVEGPLTCALYEAVLLGRNPAWWQRGITGEAAFARIEQRLLDGVPEAAFADHVERMAAKRLGELSRRPPAIGRTLEAPPEM